MHVMCVEYTGEADPSHMWKLCFGAVAGLLGQSASYPLDIVRKTHADCWYASLSSHLID